MIRKMDMFKDFFGNEIAIGDWLHLSNRDAGINMRFAKVEKIGSTGKLLMRTYNTWNGTHWDVTERLVPCHEPLLTWMIPNEALPDSLRHFINASLPTDLNKEQISI